MSKRLRGLWLLVTTAVEADWRRAAGTTLVTVIEAFSRVTRPYCLKLVVDGAIQNDGGDIALGAIIQGVSLAVLGLTNLARIEWGTILQEKTGFLLDQKLVALTAGIPSLEHHERTDYQDELALLRAQRGALGGTVSTLLSAMQLLIMLTGIVALLGRVHPVLLLLPLLGLPSLFTTAQSAKIGQAAAEESAERTRSAAHLFQLSTTAGPGKELRIFGLGDEIVRRHERLWDEHERISRRASIKASVLSAVGWAIFGGGYVACLVFVVVQAVNHPQTTTPGDIVLTFAAAGQVNGLVGGVAQIVGWTWSTLKTVGRLLWLSDYADEVNRQFGARTPPGRYPTDWSRASPSSASRSPIPALTKWCSKISTSSFRQGQPSPSSARTAPARRPW